MLNMRNLNLISVQSWTYLNLGCLCCTFMQINREYYVKNITVDFLLPDSCPHTSLQQLMAFGSAKDTSNKPNSLTASLLNNNTTRKIIECTMLPGGMGTKKNSFPDCFSDAKGKV